MEKENLTGLYQALLKAMAAIEPVARDATNPMFKSRYATINAVLEAVRKPLQDNGLALIQVPEGIDKDENGFTVFRLRTMLIHAESGQMLSFDMAMPVTRVDAQGVGSAMTYARRYAITALLGLIADDDDDGNAACGPMPQEGGAPQRRPAAAPQQQRGQAPQRKWGQEGRESPDWMDPGRWPPEEGERVTVVPARGRR